MLPRYEDGSDVVVDWSHVHVWAREIFAMNFIRDTFYDASGIIRVDNLGLTNGVQFFHAHKPGVDDLGIVYAFTEVSCNGR